MAAVTSTVVKESLEVKLDELFKKLTPPEGCFSDRISLHPWCSICTEYNLICYKTHTFSCNRTRRSSVIA